MNELVISKKTLNLLDSAYKKISHAYLFIGKDGLGKTSAAIRFAEKVIAKNPSEGDKSRWIFIVKPIDGKKLSLAQMKQVKEFCNHTSGSGLDNKVVIIDEAQNMSIEAYNSLLTLIEEPPAKTVIIMVSNYSSAIPKTILSRVQQIRFYPPSMQEISTLMIGNGIEAEYQDYIASKPARIKMLSEDLQVIQSLFDKSEKFINGSLQERLMIISTIRDKTEAKEFLDIMAYLLESKYFFSHTEESEGLILAQSHLYNNGNYKLVIERIALEFK